MNLIFWFLVRIPTVSSTMKPSLITTNRPGPGPSPGIRPQSNVITKPVGASITMIPPGKVQVLTFFLVKLKSDRY